MASKDVDIAVKIGTQGVAGFAAIMAEIAKSTTKAAAGLAALRSGAAGVALQAQGALQRQQAQLAEEARRATLTTGGRLKEDFKGLNDQLTQAGTAAKVLTASLAGLVFSGIHASAVGQIISFEWEKLSRTMAGLFRPEIQMFIEFLRASTRWLNSLNGAQREFIAKTGLLLVGLGALVIVLPLVTAGITLLTGALSLLAKHPLLMLLTVGAATAAALSGAQPRDAQGKPVPVVPGQGGVGGKAMGWGMMATAGALTALSVASGGTLIPFALAVVSAIYGAKRLTEGTPEEEAAAQGRGSRAGALPQRVGGVEAIEQTWDRIAAASVNVGAEAIRDIPQEQLDELVLIRSGVGGIWSKLLGFKSPFG